MYAGVVGVVVADGVDEYVAVVDDVADDVVDAK